MSCESSPSSPASGCSTEVSLNHSWPLGWTSLEPCASVFAGWPMGMGPDQHPYEPPRTVPKGSMKDRAARLKMLGNGVVPAQAALAYLTIFRFTLERP